MKYLFSLLLLLCVGAQAQSTTVTGQITDESGTPWINAEVTASFFPTPGFSGKYTWEGNQYQALPSVIARASNSGALSISVPSNTAITPANSKWVFSICPIASLVCQTTAPVSVTGSSQDITELISKTIPNIAINPTGTQFAYNDDEVLPMPGMGQLYYRTTDNTLRQWNGEAWVAVGGGSANISGQSPGELSVAATATSIASTVPFSTFLQTATLTTSQTVNIPNVSSGAGGGFVKFISPNISGEGTFSHQIGDPLTAENNQQTPSAIYDNLNVSGAIGDSLLYTSVDMTDSSQGTYTGSVWTIDQLYSTNYLLQRRGIGQLRSDVFTEAGVGDHAAEYLYGTFYCGMQFFQDEGCSGKVMQLAQQGFTFGTISSAGGVGVSSITTSGPNCGAPTSSPACSTPHAGAYTYQDGGIIYDRTQGGTVTATITSTGTVQGGQVANLSTAAVTVSTAWGNIASCDNVTNDHGQQYFQVVCSVTLGTSPASPGNFASGQHMCLSGPYNEEVELTTAPAPVAGVQTLTFQSRHNWIAGINTVVMQGGPCGQVIVSSAQVALNNLGWPMAWQAIGAYATNQLVFGNCHNGICNSGVSTQVLPSGAITFYQAAEVIGFVDGQSNSPLLATNSVPWTTGDLVIEAPVTEYQMNDLILVHSQATPSDGGTPSSLISLQDIGPESASYIFRITEVSTDNPFAVLSYSGAATNTFQLDRPPNTAVINITGGDDNPQYCLLVDAFAANICVARTPTNVIDFTGFGISVRTLSLQTPCTASGSSEVSCVAAPVGQIEITSSGTTTFTVNTTAVTADSVISLTLDNSIHSDCAAQPYIGFQVLSRTPGISFELEIIQWVAGVPTPDPTTAAACFSYSIIG